VEQLEAYIAKWKLSYAEPLADTFLGRLYKVQSPDGPAVLKILTDIGVEGGRPASSVLEWYDGHGAVRLFRHDARAMLLEYAGGNDLTSLARNGRDDEATQLIAGVIKQLHGRNQDNPPDDLTPLLQRFQPLFQSSMLVRAATHVLHGDLHHENVIYHPVRGWLAIDPKGLIGDRAHDAANGLCNPGSLPEIVRNRERLLRQAGNMASALDIDRQRLLSYVFVEACVVASWCLEVGADPSHWRLWRRLVSADS